MWFSKLQSLSNSYCHESYYLLRSLSTLVSLKSTDLMDLFVQDIFEGSEKLSNMLHRSSDDRLLVITEHFKNLGITREYTIPRSRIYDAL